MCSIATAIAVSFSSGKNKDTKEYDGGTLFSKGFPHTPSQNFYKGDMFKGAPNMVYTPRYDTAYSASTAYEIQKTDLLS